MPDRRHGCRLASSRETTTAGIINNKEQLYNLAHRWMKAMQRDFEMFGDKAFKVGFASQGAARNRVDVTLAAPATFDLRGISMTFLAVRGFHPALTSPRSLCLRHAGEHSFQRRRAQGAVTSPSATAAVQSLPQPIGRFGYLVWSCSLRKACGDTDSLPAQILEHQKSCSRHKERRRPIFQGS
jgi:hypothetical protein